MSIFYLLVNIIIFIVSNILIPIFSIENTLIFFILGNFWFQYIFNTIIEKKRSKMASVVSQNGLFGSRFINIIISGICATAFISPYYKSAFMWALLAISIVLLILVRKKVRSSFECNHFSIGLILRKLLWTMVIVGGTCCFLQVINYKIEYSYFSEVSFWFLEVYFLLDWMALPRNSILAKISTKLYRYNPMIEDGNDLVP